jgi:hypothetical protein
MRRRYQAAVLQGIVHGVDSAAMAPVTGPSPGFAIDLPDIKRQDTERFRQPGYKGAVIFCGNRVMKGIPAEHSFGARHR